MVLIDGNHSCYTNHALDQFLEHLMDIGIDKIIRIGGQSKSSALDGKNLRVVSKTEGKSRSERYSLSTSYESLEMFTETIKSKLGGLHKIGISWKILERYVYEKHPRIHRQFLRVDNEGFELASEVDPFNLWRLGKHNSSVRGSQTVGSIRNIVQQAERDVHNLSMQDRQTLITHWVEGQAEATEESILDAQSGFNQTIRTMDMIHDEADRRILETADVIGVTTTGLARRISVLRHLRSKVVVCEEAAEVIEAHMISALVPSIEHCIQIGDHQQLRPSVTDYGLSVESIKGQVFQLDKSQFERLCTGGNNLPPLPISQLNVQRRMRPQISRLIRETQYRRLQDDESVKELHNVVGMRQNLFWLDHQYLEEGSNSEAVSRSKSNDWEVELAHALVRHLVRQGTYKSTDIALLTPYTGQLQKLRKRMGIDFEVVLSDRDETQLAIEGFVDESSTDQNQTSGTGGPNSRLEKAALSKLLRIATVDNFQGEEAKIVVVSLVRSNKDKRVGFLKTDNRINVLLSRAQHGMYLVGNSETYSNIPMWATVLGMLRLDDLVGQSLALCCPRHPETPISCSQPEDFASLSPEGGCRLTCDKRLDTCGHKCQAKCHSDALHRVWPCPEPCPRIQEQCGHSCPKSCGEICGPCKKIVDGVQLPCGHFKDGVQCYRTKRLSDIRCTVNISRASPGCKHIVQVPCFVDVDSPDFHCPAPCEAMLPCSHICSSRCGDCCKIKNANDTADEHVPCKLVCGRQYSTCTHRCPRLCHSGSDCGICKSPCEVRCKHSKCNKPCHDPCAPCIQSCTWKCEHRDKCAMPCSAPCSRLPCDKRCDQKLACGHQCPGICGEDCPAIEYCQLCCNEDTKAQRVDMLEFRPYAEIDLDETPIIVLTCGHFYTAETLDGHMQLGEVYEMNAEGQFIALKDDTPQLSEHPPCCPDCKRTIPQFSTQRYNRSVNRSVMDEISKRFIVSGTANIAYFDQKLDEVERELDAVRHEISLVRPDQNKSKLAGLNGKKKKVENRFDNLRLDIKRFSKSVSAESQPARKLHDAIVLSMAKSQGLEDQLSTLSISASGPAYPRDNRVLLGARRVDVKALYVIFCHKSQLAGANKTKLHKDDIELGEFFFAACAQLIAETKAVHLPKVSVEATLCYGSAVRLLTEPAERATHSETAKKLLAEAEELCRTSTFKNVAELLNATQEVAKSLKDKWYDPITKDELEAIKKAMVSGRGGLATHSGHWYNCENGHPFAVGECGMPMQQARCPECGAPVGGQHHQSVAGVTRAENMER